MDNRNNYVEEQKESLTQAGDSNINTTRDPNEIIADLVRIIDDLFDPKKIINNYYLTSKARDTTFEIPVSFIYEENSVKACSMDRGLIDQAFQSCTKILVIRRNGKIEGIRPKNLETKTEVSIRGVQYNDKDDIKKFVDELTNNNSNIIFNYKPQMNIVTLYCGDETLAHEVFDVLRQSPFKGNLLECSLDSVNLYVSALDNARNRKKSFYPPKNNQYQSYPNPYFYGGYPYQGYNPYYYGPPKGYNNNNTYNDDQNFSKGGKKYYKKSYNNNNKSRNNQNREPKNFDEQEFPPLPNEQEGPK